MKRNILLLLFIASFAFVGFAKKEYVHLFINGPGKRVVDSAHLSGSVPSGMQTSYFAYYDDVTAGEILNKLADNGFVVEKMDLTASGSDVVETIILSKSSVEQGAIETVVSGDSEAVEVARYNMQGLPVNAGEKGVQIVVYSNFTAKVEIVQ